MKFFVGREEQDVNKFSAESCLVPYLLFSSLCLPSLSLSPFSVSVSVSISVSFRVQSFGSTTTRKPMMAERRFGEFLKRTAQRAPH